MISAYNCLSKHDLILSRTAFQGQERQCPTHNFPYFNTNIVFLFFVFSYLVLNFDDDYCHPYFLTYLNLLVMVLQREYFKQGKVDQFRQILEEGSSPGILSL
jgi:hypothetical protein